MYSLARRKEAFTASWDDRLKRLTRRKPKDQ